MVVINKSGDKEITLVKTRGKFQDCLFSALLPELISYIKSAQISCNSDLDNWIEGSKKDKRLQEWSDYMILLKLNACCIARRRQSIYNQ